MIYSKALIIPLVVVSIYLRAQPGLLSTDNWLKDATTITFSKPEDRDKFKNTFNGIRIIFEPQLARVVQFGSNRFESKIFGGLDRFGVEINLYKGFVSLQLINIFPSVVQFDQLSPIRKFGYSIDPQGKVAVDFGLAAGLSFFDGIIAIGYGNLFYARRDFKPHAYYNETLFRDEFIYIDIQAISAIKAAVKSF